MLPRNCSSASACNWSRVTCSHGADEMTTELSAESKVLVPSPSLAVAMYAFVPFSFPWSSFVPVLQKKKGIVFLKTRMPSQTEDHVATFG